MVTPDADSGETVYLLSSDNFNFLLTDPDNGNGNISYEAAALTNTTANPNTVIDFYDIGGGTQNIVAQNGAAAGAVSKNLSVQDVPNLTTTTLQFNQPNPDELTIAALTPGDTGVACFTAGTLIDTPAGARRIESLRPGDKVVTVDDGVQPVRWVGGRSVRGQGNFAPVLFQAGSLGLRTDLLVSP